MRNNENGIKMPKQVDLDKLGHLRFRHDDMHGRSMVEMLGVLAIVGVLSAGALKGYSDAMFKHKMNQTIDTFQSIFQRVAELDMQKWDPDTYIGYENYRNAEDAIAYGILPNCQETQGEFWDDDSACQLPTGTFQMALGSMCGYPFMGGNILLTLHDSKSCIAFLSAHWENATPIDWWQWADPNENNEAGIQVCGESCGDDYLYRPQEGQKTYDMTDITNACQICDNDGICTIFFNIRYIW